MLNKFWFNKILPKLSHQLYKSACIINRLYIPFMENEMLYSIPCIYIMANGEETHKEITRIDEFCVTL